VAAQTTGEAHTLSPGRCADMKPVSPPSIREDLNALRW
jgi:hypothetical protein